MKGLFRKAGRGAGLALCAVLLFILTCMAVAVLLQALAVLLVAVVAAVLLLPHPLRWYAEQGADAVKAFFERLGLRWADVPADGPAARPDAPSSVCEKP